MYTLPPFDDHFDPWKHNRYLKQMKKKKKCADENVENKTGELLEPSLSESSTEYNKYKKSCKLMLKILNLDRSFKIKTELILSLLTIAYSKLITLCLSDQHQ